MEKQGIDNPSKLKKSVLFIHLEAILNFCFRCPSPFIGLQSLLMKPTSKHMLALFGPPDTQAPEQSASTPANQTMPMAGVCDVSTVVTQMETALRSVGDVQVIGELSSFKQWRSGNWFFDLKDEKHTVPCMMPRRYAEHVKLKPEDGMQIVVSARVTLYRAQAKAQLMVRSIKQAGRGILLEKLERLKEKLRAEGLFDEDKKKPLPKFPRTVGIVTSPQGAAVQDIIKILRARWPGVSIILSPTRVQGEGASHEITAAIKRLDALQKADVLLVGRGGGSFEDLMSFQMENVVRAVAECETPVISAVGHESDHSLIDEAADCRAATPSHAAELAVPPLVDIQEKLIGLERRMREPVIRRLTDCQHRIVHLEHRFGEPRHLIREPQDALDRLREALQEAIADRQGSAHEACLELKARLQAKAPERQLATWRKECHQLETRLVQTDPKQQIDVSKKEIALSAERLRQATVRLQRAAHHRMHVNLSQLEALSPLAVLQRGYALVRKEDGTLLLDSEHVVENDRVAIRLRQGTVKAKVLETELPDTNDVQRSSEKNTST